MGGTFVSKITFLPQWQRSWDFAFGEYYSISHRHFSGTLSFWCSFRILAFLIPDNLVGGDWGITQAGNRAGKTRPSMQMGANGLESVFVVTCTAKLYEDSFKWLLGLYPTTKDIPKQSSIQVPRAMTSNILLTFMATIGAWLRLCAVLRSEPQQKRNQAVPKKRPFFLQETGFTNMGPCNIYIYMCVCIYVCG